MTDSNQATIESSKASNKNQQPTGNYGQNSSYAKIPNNGKNSSDNPTYRPPPSETVLPPSSKQPVSDSYTESEKSQYYSIHPELNPNPNLTDVNAVKGNKSVYQYVKSLPDQSVDNLSLKPASIQKSENEPSGLVDIYAGVETKNGVTTRTTVTPGDTITKTIPATELGRLNQVKNSKEDIRSKYEESLGVVQPEHSGGEAVTFLGMPFSKTLGIKNVGTGANDIPETRITDPLEFAVGLGGGLLNKGTELLRGIIFKDVVKPASKEISDLIVNSKEPFNPKTPNLSNGGSKFTETNINLGSGVGKLIPKDGSFESVVRTKPTTPTSKPNILPADKEISSGKGTVQLIKQEKPILLEKTTQKPLFKEYPLQLGKSEIKIIPKPKTTMNKAELLTQKYMQNLQQRRKQKQESTLSQSSEFLQSFKQVQKTSLFSKQTHKNTFLTNTKQTQHQKQPDLFIQIQKQPQIFKQRQQQSQTQPQPSKQKQTTNTITTTTKTPPPRPLYEQKKRYQKKLKKRSAKEVNFLGNAPVSSVIGLTRRADITYGNKLTSGLVRKDISRTKSRKPITFNLHKKLRL